MEDDKWETIPWTIKLDILAAESTVMPSLLVECEPFMAALRAGSSYEDCMKIINENF